MKLQLNWSPLGIVKAVLGLVLTVVFGWLIVRNVSGKDVYAAFAHTNWSTLWLMIVVISAGIVARAARWWVLLRARDPAFTLSAALWPFIMAIGLNNILPFRAGDISRLFSLRNPKLPPAYLAGTMIIERIFDLLALALIFYFTLTLAHIQISELLLRLGRLATGTVAVCILGVAVLARFEEALLGKLRSLPFVSRSRPILMLLDKVGEVIGALSSIKSMGRLAGLLGLSLLGWLLEGVFYYLVVAATGTLGGVPAALIALCVATLSTALPSAPGYVGTFHYFAAQAVMAFGTSQAVAVVYALVTHSLMWLVTTAPLLVLVPKQFFSRKKP